MVGGHRAVDRIDRTGPLTGPPISSGGAPATVLFAIPKSVVEGRSLAKSFGGSYFEHRAHWDFAHPLCSFARWWSARGCTAAAQPESARIFIRSLRGLPHQHELGSRPRNSRIQPRPHAISATRNACQGLLHGMSSETRLHGCREELRGLPRGHSSSPERRELRSVPHGTWLAGFGSIHRAAL